MNIELTQQQAQNLLQLLDVSVKAGGLNAAAPALELATIVQTAINAQKQEPQE